MSKKITRKEFMQRIALYGFGAAGAVGVLNSCGSSEEGGGSQAAKTPDPCGDTTGLTEMEIKVRTTFEYIPTSNVANKFCDNCQFWVVPAEGSPCGGCQIIKGPIHPKGYCNQWIVKTA